MEKMFRRSVWLAVSWIRISHGTLRRDLGRGRGGARHGDSCDLGGRGQERERTVCRWLAASRGGGGATLVVVDGVGAWDVGAGGGEQGRDNE
jgi:hypothetical protein